MPRPLRVLFLINPAAGNGLAEKTWKQAVKHLQKIGWDWSYKMSRQAGDLAKEAKLAASEDWDRLVVIGGDGTVHETVNGLLESGVDAIELPGLGLIPSGSGNDWARTWSFPHNVDRWFAEVDSWILQNHAAGTVHYARDGSSHQSYFMNVAGLAYDAWLVRMIEQNPRVKGHPLIYIWSILRWLFTYKPQKAVILSGDQSWRGKFYTINAGICPYSGGGMRAVPHANPSGDKLAITIAGDLPLWRIILNIWRFYTGSISVVTDVDSLHGSTLEVMSVDDQSFYVEADGEWLGECPC